MKLARCDEARGRFFSRRECAVRPEWSILQVLQGKMENEYAENAHRGRAAYSRKMRKSSRKRRIIVESESSEAEIEESQRLPVESDDET